MISEELRSRVRRLFFAEHWKVGTVATELGIHHDTVRHAIEATRFVNTQYRAKASVLDLYKSFIQLTLKDHPKLLATRLHDMITPRGYTGSVVHLRRYSTLSSKVGIPMGRVCDPSPFEMCTRRTGGAWYVPDFARSSSFWTAHSRVSTRLVPGTCRTSRVPAAGGGSPPGSPRKPALVVRPRP